MANNVCELAKFSGLSKFDSHVSCWLVYTLMPSMSVKKHLKPKKGAKVRSTPTMLPQWLWEPSSAVFPSKGELVRLTVILAIAISVGIACNRVVKFLNRQPRPFCDSSGHDISPFESDLCDPCPEHMVCTDNDLHCEHGYKKYGRLCLEDVEISQTSKKLIGWCILFVRLVLACYVRERVKSGFVVMQLPLQFCYFPPKPIEANYLPFVVTNLLKFTEPEIASMLEEIKLEVNADIKDEAFYLKKQMALNSIQGFLETRMTIDGFKEFKCPNWLAERNRPFICAFRQWMRNHMLLILFAFTMLSGFMMFSFKVHQEKRLSARAGQLYAQICQILEEHAFCSHMSKNKDEASVVFSWLRDHLLLSSERKNLLLWKKVEDLIQEDSRIDQYPKLINDEVTQTLQYLQLEDSTKEDETDIQDKRKRKLLCPSINL